MADLFNPKTVDRLCQDVIPTNKQKESAKEWLSLLEDNKLEDEKRNYLRFAQIILQDILGYPVKELDFEKNNVEFQFGDSNRKNILCFEAKGTSTKDLFAIQHRTKKEHSTPIKQTWDYIGKIGLDYGICTNYKEFVLITKQSGYSKYHLFDFKSIQSNEKKLREFIGIFSKTRIFEEGFVEKLEKESIIEEKEFTEEFYKKYHETRLMLIRMFKENNNVTNTDAIYFTQIFLNRLIFMFFVSDRGFIPDRQLFTNRILHILQLDSCTEHSRKIYDDIKELFIAFDKGSEVLGIFGFNGGMFSGKLPDKISFLDFKSDEYFKDILLHSKFTQAQLNSKSNDIISKTPQLNPIITNLLILDSFDFNSDVNVNILGHIFEQSINDLEELKKDETSKRKKDGIYYTPEYVTDYICRNTIIPYLSKSNVSDVSELLDEYDDNLSELEEKLRKTTILDPSCGSGAFLVKAVDVLLEISKEINKKKGNNTTTSNQLQITAQWNEDQETREIIEQNIYGVDINRESVEITRLSLFLKLVSNDRKLSYLDKYVKIGNSLIEDKSVDPNAFSWRDEFPEILGDLIDDKGFDIIIGNPPYVQYKQFKENVKQMQLPVQCTLDLKKDFQIPIMSDLSFYFFYHSLNRLKQNGKLGFIVTDTFMQVNAGKELRRTILDNTIIESIIKLAFNVFGDALVKTAITIFEKNTDNKNNKVKLTTITEENTLNQLKLPTIVKIQGKFDEEKWVEYFDKELSLPTIKMISLEQTGIVKKGILTGYNPFFMLTKDIIEKYKIHSKYLVPVVSKNTFGCYLDVNDYSVYLLRVNEPKGVLEKTDDGRKVLKYIIDAENTSVTAKGTNKSQKIPKLYNLVRRKLWYSLSLQNPASILIRRTIHHFPTIYENNGTFFTTDGYIEFTPKNPNHIKAHLAYMASSFFASELESIGHAAGGGALSLVPNNLKISRTLDFENISKKQINDLDKAWNKFKQNTNRDDLNTVVFKILGLEKKRDEVEKLLKTQMNKRLGLKIS